LPARRNSAPARLADTHGGDCYDVSEYLDLEPAKYFVVVTKREKRACKHCEKACGRGPGSGADHRKGLVSDGMVINTVVAKYSDHLPLTARARFWSGKRASRSAGRRWTDG